MYVVPMGDYMDTKAMVIVGRTWLRRHNPQIDRSTDTISIVRDDRTKWTIRSKNAPVREKGDVILKQISLKRMNTLIRKGYELFAVRVSPKLCEMKVKEDLVDLFNQYDDIPRRTPRGTPANAHIEFSNQVERRSIAPVRTVIRLSNYELVELKRQLQSLLSK